MMELIHTIPDYAYWLISGMVFIVLEVCVAGYFFLWLGISCIATGGIAYFFSLPLIMLALFSNVIAIITILMTKKFRRNHDTKTTVGINESQEKIIGMLLVLQSPIECNIGSIKINDTLWKIQGPDLPTGSKIQVIEIQGNMLIVAHHPF